MFEQMFIQAFMHLIIASIDAKWLVFKAQRQSCGPFNTDKSYKYLKFLSMNVMTTECNKAVKISTTNSKLHGCKNIYL